MSVTKLTVVKSSKESELGVPMGVLSDGTAFLTQGGLARLCDVDKRAIHKLEAEYEAEVSNPRVAGIREGLRTSGYEGQSLHIKIFARGQVQNCYPAVVCVAVMEYYGYDAGSHCRPVARKNFKALAGLGLHNLIYNKLKLDPAAASEIPIMRWVERVETRNVVPKGYFSVFNEMNALVLDMVRNKVPVDQKTCPDISVGMRWASYWKDHRLEETYGKSSEYTHHYPPSYPQALGGPKPAKCYPNVALAAFRQWMADEYLDGGQFEAYLRSGKKLDRAEISSMLLRMGLPDNTIKRLS